MNYIKENQRNLIIGLIIVVVFGLLLWSQGGDTEISDNNVDTSTSTTTSTSDSNQSGGAGSTYKPAPTTGKSIVPMPPVPTSQTPVPSIPSAASLEGIIFRMASYNGVALPADAKYTLTLEKGRLSAKFCNSMSGNFTLDGSLLRVNNLMSTQMYCSVPSNLMEIESAFTSMLNFGAIVYRSDDNIIISSSSKSTVMVFVGF